MCIMRFQSSKTILIFLSGFLFAIPFHAQVKKDSQIVENRLKKYYSDEVFLLEVLLIGNNKYLQTELEVTKDQIVKAQPILKAYLENDGKFHAKNALLLTESAKLRSQGKIEEAQKLQTEVDKRTNELYREPVRALKSILLPHQVRRLKEIVFQRTVRMKQPHSEFLDIPTLLAADLNLSSKATKELRANTEKERGKYLLAFNELKLKGLNRILAGLPKETSQALKARIGEPFEMELSRRSLYLKAIKDRDSMLEKSKQKRKK